MGSRCSQRHAFPRHRATATLWNKCLVQVEVSWGVTLWAMAFPIEWMMALESSANPPRVSATTGMKSTLQSGRLRGGMPACAAWTPTCRAWPGVEAALCKVSCWRGEITCTSSAAGRPWLQVGRSMSAGLEWESGPH